MPASSHAAHAAFECLGTSMTYAEWDRVSRAFAASLLEEVKCRPGDRVAIMLPNLLAYPVAFLGVLRAGLVVVNVNPLYTPRELREQLADSGATAIVIMENFAHKLETVLAETQIRHVLVARLGDFMPPLKRMLFNARQHLHAPRGAGLAFAALSRCCRRPAVARRARRIRMHSRRPRRPRCCNIPAAPPACRKARC